MHFDVMSFADAMACQDDWERRGRPACLIPRGMPDFDASCGRARSCFRLEWFTGDPDQAALVATAHWFAYREQMRAHHAATAGKKASAPRPSLRHQLGKAARHIEARAVA